MKHGINGELRQKGKVAELACGYGGSVGAMKAMGGDALNLTDPELNQIVTDWRDASPNIVKLWWAVDDAVKKAIKQKATTETHGLQFCYQSKMLFITLPSGRKLCYTRHSPASNVRRRLRQKLPPSVRSCISALPIMKVLENKDKTQAAMMKAVKARVK